MNTKEMIALYYKRIGLLYNPEEPLDGALLRKLQFAHVTTVPYETCDIVAGIPLSMEPEALLQKIVIEHRGGYCFELNGAFGWLLRAIGFEVKDYMARFLRGEKEIPKRRHRVLAVEADGTRFLCDVGVGSPAPRYPLCMECGTIQEQFGEAYRFRQEPFFGWVIEERNEDGSWSNYFSYSEEEQLDKDYIAPSFYCENHPDSPFLHLIVSLKNETGRIGIDRDLFRIWEHEKLLHSQTLSPAELPVFLERYFGLSER